MSGERAQFIRLKRKWQKQNYMSNQYFAYRDLRVYQQAKDFVVFVYSLIKLFPKEENYALCDQLRRACVSIPSNIVEGMSRTSTKEQLHFMEISYGSLCETMCQLEIAYELHFINDEQLHEAEVRTTAIAQMLSGLKKKRMSTANH